MNGFGQFGNVGRIAFAPRFHFGQFACRDEIDRPEAFALQRYAFELCRLTGGHADAGRVKCQFLRQRRSAAFEPLPRDTAHLNAPQFLIFGSCLCAGTDFARIGQHFGSSRHGRLALAQCRFCRTLGIHSSLRSFSESRCLDAEFCKHIRNPRRRIGMRCLFIRKRLRALCHVRDPFACFAAPRPPVIVFGPCGNKARRVGNGSSVARCQIST